MVLRKFQILAFCFGLVMSMGGMYVQYQSSDGIVLITFGVFLMGGAGGLYFVESRDDKEILRREKIKVNKISKPSYNRCLETREIILLRRSTEMVRQELFQDSDLSKDAEENLGWGRKKKEELREDWWLKLPPVECGRCKYIHVLVEEDLSRIRFPLAPDPERGIYVEVPCKNCGHRKTVFRNS